MVSRDEWHLFGYNVPKMEIVFFSQVIVLYMVIVTCIVNLSIANGDSNLWSSLLSGSLGYLLPSPTLKNKDFVVRKPNAGTINAI